jgi:peptidyl-prolyl isomerase D
VRHIENYPTSTGDVPTSPIVIADCGVLSPDDPSLSETATADGGDPFEDYPEDEDRDTDQPEIALEIAQAVREVGNKLFKEGKTEAALEKYQSVFIHVSLWLPELFDNELAFQNPFDTWISIRCYQTALRKPFKTRTTPS